MICVIVIKLQEVEWFSGRHLEIAASQRASDRKKLIKKLKRNGDPLWDEYLDAAARAEKSSIVVRSSGHYPLLGRGDINIYSLFVERAQHLVAPGGIVGLVTPSGIAADKGAAEFFRSVATSGRLGTLFDFENKKVFFPDVHSSFKFCTLVFGGKDRLFAEAQCAFYIHHVDELADPEKSFSMSPDDFAAVNPNTGTAPIFRSRKDAQITTVVYSKVPPLVDRRIDPPRSPWEMRYVRMFDMTNDSGLFKRQSELEDEGFYPISGNQWRRGKEEYLPLYEGKMVQMYDHRAAGIVVNPDNIHRPASPEMTTPEQHGFASWLPTPQFWIASERVDMPAGLAWTLAFKDVTAPTNSRTMIATLVPLVGLGNTLPALLPTDDTQVPIYREYAPLLLANLNSFVLDYVARQKVQGQHLNWYIVEQLPVLLPKTFDEKLGDRIIGDYVREQVLHLTYTSENMKPFAHDMGYRGKPFKWDDEDRRHRVARLDALFFHLYGIAREDVDYILDTFPIVREHDKKVFGDYRTKRLVLAYLNAIAAGDLDTDVDL